MNIKTGKPLTWPELTAIAEGIGSGKIKRGRSAGKASINSDSGFRGTQDMPEAVGLMRYGWEDGTRTIIDGLDNVTAEVETVEAFDLEPAGAFPCVPAFVAGDADCMWNPTAYAEKPRMVLTFGCRYHCMIDEKDVREYGKALAAVVRELEARGVDVAVYAVDATRDGAELGLIGIEVKPFGDVLDLGRIAMAGHPSFLRRCLFAYWESRQDVRDINNSGYGCPVNPTEEQARMALQMSSDERLVSLPAAGAILMDRPKAPAIAELFRKAIAKV